MSLPRCVSLRLPGARSSGGFALAVVLLTLLIVSAAVAGGIFIARTQIRSSPAPLEGLAGLYAAESGLTLAMERLRPGALDSLPPGATLEVAVGELANGDAFVARVTRMDDGRIPGPAYYVLRSWGSARRAWGGGRQVALFLKRSDATPGCCAAALSARGELTLGDSVSVSGVDEIPDAWEAAPDACAGSPPADRAGVAFDSTGSLMMTGTAELSGSPPLLQPAPAELARGVSWLREAALLADIELRPGESPTVGPALSETGECDLRRPTNWGSPRDPLHPCFDHAPIIHVAGHLSIDSDDAGQGILAVEGDLTISGDFDFYGLVIVGGRLTRLTGQGRLVGGVVVLDAAGVGSEVGGGGSLAYSSCAVERVVRISKLYLPHPLAQFSWVEILD